MVRVWDGREDEASLVVRMLTVLMIGWNRSSGVLALSVTDPELRRRRTAMIRGHSWAKGWRNDGRQAQIMPMLTSAVDQTAIEALSLLLTVAV